jgi:hypothetical protein
MEFDYRILGRQQPETVVNVMYPRINAESAPVLAATDGADIVRYEVVKAYTMERGVAITSSAELSGSLTLTADRAIFVAPHIDRTKWIDSSGSDMAIFGVGTTIATDLVWNGIGKLTKRARGVSEQALTGHIYYPWISSISHSRGRGRSSPPVLRLGMTVQVGSDPTRELLLYLVFKRGIETADVGGDIFRRVLLWRLRSGERLTSKLRSDVEQLARHGTLGEPEGQGRFAGRTINNAVPARPQNMPVRLIERYAEDANQQRRLTTAELHERIRTTGHLFMPQYEYITLMPGSGHESKLGFRIRSDGRLGPLDSEKACQLVVCDLEVIVRTGQDWSPQAGMGSKPDGCFAGEGELLLTDYRICCQMIEGRSRTGQVGRGSSEVIVASLPLDSIDSIGVVLLSKESDVWSLVVRNNAGGDLIFRPHADKSHTEHAEPWDLDLLAAQAAGLVASRRGVAPPPIVLAERQRTYEFGADARSS